jgi:hypothetical protein
VEEVNTAASETQPTISSDNMTLIITSGPPRTDGFGRADLYISTRTKLRGRR